MSEKWLIFTYVPPFRSLFMCFPYYKHLGFAHGELPFKYLGIPLSAIKITLVKWQPLIQKIVRRISSWTTKKLSYAGRLQLVQTVIFVIQAYWAQLYILPTSVLQMIDAYCRSYVWSGTNVVTKKDLVAWSNVCSPKDSGGLNLTNLSIWNNAAIATKCWDLANKQDRLWIKWIHSCYVKHQSIFVIPMPKQASWMVKQIIATRSVESKELVFVDASGSRQAVNSQSSTFFYLLDPLFLQSSDVSGVNLAHYVLTGMENYILWSKSMRAALLGKNKIGFLDGTCKNEMYEGQMACWWELVNAIVLFWIMSSILKDLVNGIVYYSNAHKVWMDIKECFNKVNATKIYHVHRGIATLV
ncbi:hypothetical protein P3L10_034131 [Capsicum annuum]